MNFEAPKLPVSKRDWRESKQRRNPIETYENAKPDGRQLKSERKKWRREWRREKEFPKGFPKGSPIRPVLQERTSLNLQNLGSYRGSHRDRGGIILSRFKIQIQIQISGSVLNFFIFFNRNCSFSVHFFAEFFFFFFGVRSGQGGKSKNRIFNFLPVKIILPLLLQHLSLPKKEKKEKKRRRKKNE